MCRQKDEMKRDNRSWDNKSRFSSPKSKVAIVTILIVAIVLIGLGSFCAYDATVGHNYINSLFNGEQLNPTDTSVAGITFPSSVLGMTANLDEVYVTLTYSDGSSREVALSKLNPQGLDQTVEGKQKFTINYGGKEWDIDVEVVSSDITIEYTSGDGGYIEGTLSQTLPAGQNCSTVKAVPDEGYEFDVWQDGYTSPTRKDTAVSQDAVYRALFKKKTYTVRFQRADGTYDVKTVSYGDPVDVPSGYGPLYKKYGQTFVGWDIDSKQFESVKSSFDVKGKYEKNAADFELYVTADSSLYIDTEGEFIGALGFKDTYTTQSSHTNGSGSQTSVIATTPASSSVGRTAIKYSGFYEYGATSKMDVVANDKTILSKWLVETASGAYIEISPDGGSVRIPVLSTGIDATTFTTSKDGSTYSLQFSLSKVDATAILRVIAVMEYEQNTITFEEMSDVIGSLNLTFSETLSADAVYEAIKDKATVSTESGALVLSDGLPVLEKYGYTFQGWFIKNSLTKVTSSTLFSESIAIEARYVTRTFDVTFMAGDSTLTKDADGIHEKGSVDYNSSIGTAYCQHRPERENYTFIGWFEQGSSEPIVSNTIVRRDMVVYPAFSPTPHAFTVSVTDGQPDITIQEIDIYNSVYSMEEALVTKTSTGLTIGTKNYEFYPTTDIISQKVGTYQNGLIEENGTKKYFVYNKKGYKISVDTHTVTTKNGKVFSFTDGADTYYLYPSDTSVSKKTGTYSNKTSVISTSRGKFYLGGIYNYKMTEQTAVVNFDNGQLVSFSISGMPYYHQDGIVYLDKDHTSPTGQYDPVSGLLTFDTQDSSGYYISKDESKIYSLSSVASSLTKTTINDQQLTVFTTSDNTFYIDAENNVFEEVGERKDSFVEIGDTRFYIDFSEKTVLDLTPVSYLETSYGITIDNTSYYVNGEDLLIESGSFDGKLYTVDGKRYFITPDSKTYVLGDLFSATIDVDSTGLISVSYDGTLYSVSSDTATIDGKLYYVDIEDVTHTDTSTKEFLETKAYIYTITFTEDYQLDTLMLNGTDLKSSVSSSSPITLVFAKGKTSPIISIEEDLSLTLGLKLKTVTATVNYVGGEGTTEGDLTIEKGGTAEIVIKAPENMAIAKVEVDGVSYSVTKGSTEYYLRFTAMDSDLTVTVTLETLSYSVTVNGADQGRVNYNEPFSYNFEAEEGKYISKIYQNGVSLNLYDSAYTKNGINKVNYRDKIEGVRDLRITSLTLSVEKVTENLIISAEYADISYTGNISVQGKGVLTTASNVTYGWKGRINALVETEKGYTVSSCIVKNGEDTTTYTGEIPYIFDNLQADVTIEYIVRPITYTVVVKADTTLSVTTASSTENGTLFDYSVQFESDFSLTITAPSDRVIATAKDGENLITIPYKKQSITLYFDKVTASKTIDITTELSGTETGDGNIVVKDSTLGSVSVKTASEKTTKYTNGENITVRVIPKTGYDFVSVPIKIGTDSTSYTKSQFVDKGGYYEYTFTESGSKDIEIGVAEFNKKTFTLTVSPSSYGKTYKGIIGQSGLQEVSDGAVSSTYDSVVNLTFKANEGYYIKDIKVDGVVVEDYIASTVSEANKKNKEVTVALSVKSDMEIEAVYQKDTFSVAVSNSVEGTVSTDKTEYGSGEDVIITIKASTGYHITKLYINSLEIDSRDFLKSLDPDNLKYNTTATYTYHGIKQNLNVVAEFATNTYVLNYYAYNYSENFSGIDTSYQDYGNIDVLYDGEYLSPEVLSDGVSSTGSTMYRATFRGIEHGNSLTLNLSGIVKNGYIIKSVVLSLNSGSTIELTSGSSSAQYGFTIDSAREKASLSLYSIEEDVFSVVVNYVRKTINLSASFTGDYRFGNLGPELSGDTKVGFTFDNDKSDKVPTVVENAQNSYTVEYGLRYRLMLTAVQGFNISSFKAGGVKIGYVDSMRDGKYYDAVATSDLNFDVWYEKRSFNLTMTVFGEELGSASFEGTSALTKQVFYGDNANVLIAPDTAKKGGYVARFVVNGTMVSIKDSESTMYALTDIQSDTAIQVYFERQTLDISYITREGGSVTIENLSGESFRGSVKWGDSIRVTVDVNESYNLTSYIVKGLSSGTSTTSLVTDDIVTTLQTGKRIVFTISDIKENTEISLPYQLKEFKLSISKNNSSYGKVEVISRETGSIVNGSQDALTDSGTVICLKAYQFNIIPEKGYIIDRVVFRMKNSSGAVEVVYPEKRTYSTLNTDAATFILSGVSGDVTVEVTFIKKSYSLKVNLSGETPTDALSSLSLKTASTIKNITNFTDTITGLTYGSQITFTLAFKEGYDFSGFFVINNRNYYGTSALSVKHGNAFTYEATFTINDELMNVLTEDGQLVIGSGTDFNINVDMTVSREVYKEDLVKINVTGVDDTNKVLTVSEKTNFTFGQGMAVSAKINEAYQKGYYISEFYIDRSLSGLDNIDVFEISGLEKTLTDGFVTAVRGTLVVSRSSYATYTEREDNKNLYDKTLKLVLKFVRRDFVQQTTEFVYDNVSTYRDASKVTGTNISATTAEYQYRMQNGSTVETVTGDFVYTSSLTNVSPAPSDAIPSSMSKTTIPFGSVVTVESNINDTQGIYEFYAFEEYIDQKWTRVLDGINGITFISNSKFEYSVDSDRIFRAVYVRYYEISFELLPFHKATSGIAPNINYVAYTSLSLTSTDGIENLTKQEKLLESKSTTSKNVYRVPFGATITAKGSDTFTSGRNSNSSTGVAFYDSTDSTIADATAPDSFSTSFVVKTDGEYYAVFKNNVQAVLTYETVGGQNEAGGIVTVTDSKDKTLSRTTGSDAYSYKTTAYETIKIRISVNDYYRIEGFYELTATNRDTTANLLFMDMSRDDSYQKIFGYTDLYKDEDLDGVADTNSATLENGNYKVERDGDIITISIFVVNNTIYKIKYVKTFAINTDFIIGYDEDGTKIENSSSIQLSNPSSLALKASDGTRRFDYGTKLSMSISSTDSVANSSDYQFIGWYFEGGGKVSNLCSLAGTYRDDLKFAHEINLKDEDFEEITALSQVNTFKITIEYLPVYTLYLNHAYDYLGSSDTFLHATEKTTLETIVYSSSVLNIPQEIRTDTTIENRAERGTPSDLKIMTRVVDITGGYSDAVNSIILTADVSTSYNFNYWEVSTDGTTYQKIDGTDNKATYSFDLVKFITTTGLTGTTFYFRPNLSKINVVNVSRVVYYDNFGTSSNNPSALQDTGAYIGSVGTTKVSGLFGTSVDLTATHSSDYRFIGWFDKTGKNANEDINATPYSTDEKLTVNLEKNKSANYGSTSYYTDYTYEYEARFIRIVTVTFSVVNASAQGDLNFTKSAPYIYGVEASNTYLGSDNAGNITERTTVDTSSIKESARKQKVELTMDAGSFAVLKLSTVANTDGFNPATMFRSGFATGGSCYFNETDGYYTIPFNYKRSIVVQYVTYGDIRLQNVLPNVTLTYPAQLAEVYKEGVSVASANGIDVQALYGINQGTYEMTAADYTVTINGDGELVVTTKEGSNKEICLPYIKKADYKGILQKLSLSQMKSGYFVETFDLEFSYKHPSETLTLDLSQKGFMPFAGGLGLETSPYIISTKKQLASIEALYRTTSNSPDTVSDEIVEFNGVTFVSNVENVAKYSVKGIYFKMDDTVPASERYLSLSDWTPLCRNGQGFNSTFDGSSYEIGNIITTEATDYFGIFGKSQDATFREVDFMGGNNISGEGNYVGLLTGYAVNVKFVGINVKGNNETFLGGQTDLGIISSKGNYVGTLSGYAKNCTLENVYLRAITVTGIATPTPKVNEGGDYIKDPYGNVIYETVGGQYVGGIFGYAIDTDIGSVSTTTTIDNITVQGGSYIGGAVGEFLSDAKQSKITNITLTGSALSFGIKDQSFNVGGIVGHLGENTSLEKVSIGSGAIRITVEGYYRSMSQTSVVADTDEYSFDSAIGGFVGYNEGTVNDVRLQQGYITLKGSIAGGFIGVNGGTAVNLYIGIAGRISFNLQHSGYYGGMIGHNLGGAVVNNCRIGSYGTFSGLSSNASQLISSSSGIEDNANVTFFADGQINVSGETYGDKNGTVRESWGFNAMGGMVGVNSGHVYNSTTYGKVVAYRRLKSGAKGYNALGGIVGANLNNDATVSDAATIVRVINCGASYAISINYSVLVSTSSTEVSENVAIGSVIGHHGIGFASGLYSYHSGAVGFYNVGAPQDSDYTSATLTSNVAGVASSLSGMGFGQFQSSWAYYNSASYDNAISSGVWGNKKITDTALLKETLHNPHVAYDAVNDYGPEPPNGWSRFTYFPTNQNYNTWIGKTTAVVYNSQGNNLSDFFKAYIECQEGYQMTSPYNAELYNSSGEAYYIDPSTGKPDTSKTVKNTYNSSSSKASDWMI